MQTPRRAALWPLIAFAAAYLTVVLLVQNQYYQLMMTLVPVWATMGISWNILSGYSGLVSFGHASFFGLGAYTVTLLLVHLGLSPYYRGSGTNFWPLVNGAPEFVGATFMHLDAGVDTGEIIHQVRARVFPNDTPHQIGNRLIVDMVDRYAAVIRNFDRLQRMPQPQIPPDVRVYRSRDFTEAATRQLYDNFAAGLVATYLAEQDRRVLAVPIVQNSAVLA